MQSAAPAHVGFDGTLGFQSDMQVSLYGRREHILRISILVGWVEVVVQASLEATRTCKLRLGVSEPKTLVELYADMGTLVVGVDATG